MLFNSFTFIIGFLPIILITYYVLIKYQQIKTSKFLLIFGSLFFYGWWNINYLPLILISMFVNYYISTKLNKNNPIVKQKIILTLGLIFNIGLLCYFKYYDFFIENINNVFTTDIKILHLVLPLAISFFTFQQIAYLVDSYRGETKDYHLLDYALFVTFFPQLIAGPIVRHNELIPQFNDIKKWRVVHKNIALGAVIFILGLFKKVVIADNFAIWANAGFDHVQILTFMETWISSLSYTLQLYFDFSGYADMAIGLALLFNITLPLNFNSPYKSLNIQDFWRRWHITLSRFLTMYIYFPLGGNRRGNRRTYINIMIIFFISGLWHGAGWTFIIWGLMHGLATVVYRAWSKGKYTLKPFFGWLITFGFVNIAWIFFRASSVTDALIMIKKMFSMPSLHAISTNAFTTIGSFEQLLTVIVIAVAMILLMKNEPSTISEFKPSYWKMIGIVIIFVISLLFINSLVPKEFLYFDF